MFAENRDHLIIQAFIVFLSFFNLLTSTIRTILKYNGVYMLTEHHPLPIIFLKASLASPENYKREVEIYRVNRFSDFGKGLGSY